MSLVANQRHPRAPYCGVCRRESFQTSPQLVQRQQLSASGIFEVVTIDDDRHVGHDAGPVCRIRDVNVTAGSGREAKSFTRPPESALVGWRPKWPRGSGKRVRITSHQRSADHATSPNHVWWIS
jgi:hypothetical protein